MLASTIQFSKYGQEHQPRTTTYRVSIHNQGNNTPRNRHPHQRFDESRPQPPNQPTGWPMTLEETVPNPQNNTSCEPGPIPQDPTARLGHSPTLTHVPRKPRRTCSTS